MDPDYEFSEDEIREQLEALGYQGVPHHRLAEFKRDLEQLVRHERSRNHSLSTTQDSYLYSQAQSDSSDAFDSRVPRYPPQQVYNPAQRPGHNVTTHSHAKYGKENQMTHPAVESYTKHSFAVDDRQYKQFERVPRQEMRERRGIDVKPRREFSTGGGSSYPRTAYEEEEEETDSTSQADYSYEYANSTTSSERKMMKRKVLRKRNGEAVIDESITESEPDDMRAVRDRLQHLPIREEDDTSETGSDTSSVRERYPRRPYSARDWIPPRSVDGDAYPKSVIWTAKEHPHTKNIKRSDPVSRHQQFKQAWQKQKAPGEKQHKGLRWNVREMMLYHDEVVKKPQRVFVPNSYVVPTSKQRKSLRWQVRTDMAQGAMPPTGYFYEY